MLIVLYVFFVLYALICLQLVLTTWINHNDESLTEGIILKAVIDIHRFLKFFTCLRCNKMLKWYVIDDVLKLHNDSSVCEA